MRFVKWLAILAPAMAGLILDVLISRGVSNIPILYMRADVGIFLLLAGLLLTLVCAGGTLFYDWSEHRMETQATAMHEEANDERRRFLRRLDHELKNPLTAIRAGLANISEGTSAPGRQEALNSVETQALRLSRLAADLRKLAELETRTVERVPVDMAAMLEEVITLAKDTPDAADRKLTLTLPRAPWPLPKISGDQDLLFLAMHNLLDNAIKFTRPGDTIEVRAIEDGSTMVIEIADTGPGIADEDIPHVWEELYRGQGARGVPGSGLGLALVRAIAERHNGQVSLRSRAGQGTVFTLKLPVD